MRVRKHVLTILIFGMFTMVMGVIVVVMNLGSEDGRKDQTVGLSKKPVIQSTNPPLKKPQPIPALSPRQAAERFLSSKSDEERLKWVAEADRISPLLSEFYANGSGRDERIDGIEAIPDSSSGEGFFARFKVLIKGGGTREICIQSRQDGVALVDFKSYARYCSVPWKSLLEGEVSFGREMRLNLARGNYYNHGFTDEGKWISLIGSSPDIDGEIHLYVDRKDPTVSEIEFRMKERPFRYTVAIESEGDSFRRRQFILRKVIQQGWLEQGPEEAVGR